MIAPKKYVSYGNYVSITWLGNIIRDNVPIHTLENVSPYKKTSTTDTKNVRKGGWITLRTFSLLKGLRVYTERGESIGKVSDICISDSGKVEGIIIHRKAFFKKTMYLSLNDVHSFGPEGIILGNDKVLQEEHKPVSDHYFFHADSISGKMLMSEAGEELGLLQDVYFLEKKGTIVAYETTDGFFSEIAEGKRLVESKQPPALGKDAIVISVYDQ